MVRYGPLLALVLYFLANPVWSDDSSDTKQVEHDEMKLHTDVLKEYNSDMRPVRDHKSAVTVKVRFALKYLSFDSSEEMVTVHSWVALNWNDAFLTWTPSDYGDINEIQIESHEIWTPGMALFNADATSYNSDSFYTTCLVTNTGKVTCVPHLAHTGICRTTLKRWPYDVQNCTLYFGSWMHTGEQINFTFYNLKPVVLDDFQNGAGWKLLNVVNERLPGKYNLNSTYPMLKYTFMLRREAAGLAAIVVAPSVILVLVTLASLLLDVKDNTRLILLCFSLFGHFTMTSEIGYVVPKLSTDTPIILLLVRDSMIITLTAIFVTMVLMSLRKQVVPAPAWIMTLNRLVSIGPGKYMVFTEFDPSDGAEGKIVSEDPRTEEKSTRSASDWIKFATVLNNLTFVILLFVYIILICTCIPSDK
ncbi:acetylcholine receptor subunit beta-type acr-2-like [Pararge aegeria]|uniref:Jg2898 protein n=1 Tax=Pararge aegeria aegeria TaxID=348720 RepID=A0A8S4SLN2_9NEOP|nr:acetylcholine receptor subunit beta-type acr-2-like [Pararge aegeria]CAH2267163.1 jg2898 [Pararge aegeria aegeria]